MRSVVIVIPYFGRWPEWFAVFLASCASNSTVEWHFHTDCPIPSATPRNVKFYPTTFHGYCRRVADALGIPFAPVERYKIIDMRAAIGVVHADEIAGFDNFGFGDIDVVYGDIRKFYTDEVLSHDIVSSHKTTISGHLCLLRNTPSVRFAFQRIPRWQELLADPNTMRFDEDFLWLAFTTRFQAATLLLGSLASRLLFPDASSCGAGSWRDRYRWVKSMRWADHVRRGVASLAAAGSAGSTRYFKEQFSTVLTPYPWHDGSARHPDIWYWRDGRLTNSRDGSREFLYLHFMNFVSARHVKPGEQAAWRGLSRLVHFDPADIEDGVVRIDRTGFHLERGQPPPTKVARIPHALP